MEQTDLPVHPAADVFPMMTERELQKLARDIKANGLLEPLWTYKGQLLDGRNRLAACRLADVQPRYQEVEINGTTPTLWVISKNIVRRHLDASQLSTVAQDLKPLLEAEGLQRKIEGGKIGGIASGESRRTKDGSLMSDASSANETSNLPAGVTVTANTKTVKGRSSTQAAEALGISRGLVEYAAIVKREAPELFEKVKRGEVSATAAYQMVRKARIAREAAEGKRYMAPLTPLGNPDTTRAKQRMEAEVRRMERALAYISGTCRTLNDELNFDVLKHALKKTEVKVWTDKARECARLLRQFAQVLEQQ